MSLAYSQPKLLLYVTDSLLLFVVSLVNLFRLLKLTCCNYYCAKIVNFCHLAYFFLQFLYQKEGFVDRKAYVLAAFLRKQHNNRL